MVAIAATGITPAIRPTGPSDERMAGATNQPGGFQHRLCDPCGFPQQAAAEHAGRSHPQRTGLLRSQELRLDPSCLELVRVEARATESDGLPAERITDFLKQLAGDSPAEIGPFFRLLISPQVFWKKCRYLFLENCFIPALFFSMKRIKWNCYPVTYGRGTNFRVGLVNNG